jgi:hypothetical protein
MLPIKSLKLNKYFTFIKLKKDILNIIKKYLDILKNKIFNHKEKLSKNLFTENSRLNLIHFFINIFFNKSNVFLHILDSLGNEIYFNSIGSLLQLKKQKIRKIEIYKKLSNLILTKFNYLKNAPLALKIYNDFNSMKFIVKKLKKKLLLVFLEFSSSYPYNGCRKRKQ